MFPQQRWNLIAEMLEQNNSITVVKLAKELKVSESTVRRDLLEMERMNFLIRTHGGAVSSTNKISFEPSFVEKELANYDEKKLIGIAAAELIEEGETIILDAGTTNLEVARNISVKDVTVLTNSIDVIYELSKKDWIKVISTGGYLRQKTRSLVGNMTLENLRQFRVDKAFIGVNGISLKDGISTPNLTEAYTKRAMVDTANEVIVVADRSKFNAVSFSLICPLNLVNTIITTKISSDLKIDFENKGVSIKIID